MATFLAICQDACDDAGIDRPSVVVGSTGDTEKRLFAIANRSGVLLARQYPWTILQKEHTFTTSNGDGEYDLPSDFDRFIDQTAWDRDAYWSMRGPLSPQAWQAAKSGILQSASLRKQWRVKKSSAANTRSFYIDPTPSSSDDLVFEYISNGWCASSGGTAQAAWAADTDVNVIDDMILKLDLSWRLRRSLGLSFQDERNDAETAAATYFAGDGGAPLICMGKPVYRYPVNIPETGFGS